LRCSGDARPDGTARSRDRGSVLRLLRQEDRGGDGAGPAAAGLGLGGGGDGEAIDDELAVLVEPLALVPRRIGVEIAVIGDALCYLSFDIDAIDPAFAPGTGTPEIGGLATWQAQAILRGLAGLRFRGMDVVEVAPPYDVAEITALAAATMAWEYLSLLA
jgi:hypothetical protein